VSAEGRLVKETEGYSMQNTLQLEAANLLCREEDIAVTYDFGI
jgi:hypothetical protein